MQFPRSESLISMSSTSDETESLTTTMSDEIIARFNDDYYERDYSLGNLSNSNIHATTDEINNEVNLLYQHEYLFLDNEKKDKKYYIGSYTIIKSNKDVKSVDPYDMILTCSISPSSFFKFPLNIIEKYLYDFSIVYHNHYGIKRNVEILQLHINEKDSTYNVVVKTYWLKVIQKWWKKIWIKRKAIHLHKMKISSMRYFEVYGNWGII